MNCIQQKNSANGSCRRIIEEEIESAIDSRNDSLSALRELGPPDLVHLVKQSVKSGGRQVYHTGDCYNELALLICLARPESTTMSPAWMRPPLLV